MNAISEQIKNEIEMKVRVKDQGIILTVILCPSEEEREIASWNLQSLIMHVPKGNARQLLVGS